MILSLNSSINVRWAASIGAIGGQGRDYASRASGWGDILLVEVDPPRSAPIGLSRHGETRLARSTFNGFADAKCRASRGELQKLIFEILVPNKDTGRCDYSAIRIEGLR